MNVLVTGATKGIGYYITVEFIKRGYSVYGVGRDKSKLQEMKEKFLSFTPLEYDLLIEENIFHMFDFFDRNEIKIDILVNNAGMGSIGKFSDISLEESRKVINFNIISLTCITKLFLERIKERDDNIKERGIINVASTGAYQSGGPYIAIYYATKSFVKSFTEGLLEELREDNIKVMCVCPGPVKTEFKGMENIKNENIFIMSPQKVAEIAIKDYFKNKEISIPGTVNKILVFISKFIPRKLELKILKKIQKKKIKEEYCN